MSLLSADYPKDVLVLGAGKTGLSCGAYLVRLIPEKVKSVTLYAGTTSEMTEALSELKDSGARVILGTEQVQGSYDLALISPGIPKGSAFAASAAAASREVCSDVELAWQERPERWLAVTGTNGKTTTTKLLCAMMRAQGLLASAVGNIGKPVLEAIQKPALGRWFCAELSSFQLDRTIDFHPRAAALLNISPDHLEWHGSYQAYAAAKERIFANMTGDDLAVVSIDDPLCSKIAQRLTKRGLRVLELSVTRVPETPDAAYMQGSDLMLRRGGEELLIGDFSRSRLKGPHNAQNVLAAAALACEAGVDLAPIYAAVLSFVPIEHRIEPVGSFEGIAFVNDSKATNADSTIKAIESFEPLRTVVLLGGHDKQCAFDELAAAVTKRCRVAVCFGESGDRIADALEEAVADRARGCTELPGSRRSPGSSPLTIIRSIKLADAFEAALAVAVPGDTVLLSPACSSFDEFSNMGERGRYFKHLVQEYMAERS